MVKMARARPPEIRQAVAEGELPIARMIPSGLTIIGLCCGATAMRFAWYGHFKGAVAAIVAAAVFDLLDGRAARLFGTDSAFGAQLDSLADLVSFGIAPAMLVYMWTLNSAGAAGWAAVLAFCVCCAVRLARFNIEADAEQEDKAPVPYFTGVPTPAAACLILLPLLLSFQFSGAVLQRPYVSIAVMALTSLLMISRTPTVSLKGYRVPRAARGAVTAFAILLLLSAVWFPWTTMSVGLIAYALSLPVSAVLARPAQE
jgi:CDP-diacylglycerol--serine O-phosphatidyltransferase